MDRVAIVDMAMQDLLQADVQQKLSVPNRVYTPRNGVRLTGGLLNSVFDNNIDFLKSFSVDRLLYWFRRKAGIEAPGAPYDYGTGTFETYTKGSGAGVFLMGAGNALRWVEDGRLQSMVDEVVEGIDLCKESDGYIMAAPKSEFRTLEYPNYVRSYLTYGLTYAHEVGNSRALELIRGMQDWFNECDVLPFVNRMELSYEGIIANTNMYLSPAGAPKDIEVAKEYYQEDWRLDQFIANDPDAVEARLGPFPHGIELTSFEGYMDLYRITGEDRYLQAVTNAYEMYRESWQHVGGGIVMCENDEMYPGCNWLAPTIGVVAPGTPRGGHDYGELCCSVFWIKLNQRFHWLNPEEERFVNEIEKSVYNVGVANQVGGNGIRYHAFIDGHKDGNTIFVSCCAGTGTRLYGLLPELLYSVGPDGLWVNIYSPSEIAWETNSALVTLRCETGMPYDGAVALRVATGSPVALTLRVRIPSWASEDVEIKVNGGHAATGRRGSYAAIEREWTDGDEVSFTLPMGFRASKYSGGDAILGHDRYALEYGPLLMGVTGTPNFQERINTFFLPRVRGTIKIDKEPESAESWLMPIPGKPLHFSVAGQSGHEYMPYLEIQDEPFTCYPVMEPEQ